MKHARHEHHFDLVAKYGLKQSTEGSRRSGVLPDEDGRELEIRAGGESGKTFLGAVDFGSADQELLAQVGVGPR